MTTEALRVVMISVGDSRENRELKWNLRECHDLRHRKPGSSKRQRNSKNTGENQTAVVPRE